MKYYKYSLSWKLTFKIITIKTNIIDPQFYIIKLLIIQCMVMDIELYLQSNQMKED